MAGLERGRLVAAGRGLVVANVAGTLLAYRDRCAGCGGGLADGELAGGTLACAHCGRRFDLPRAGRGVDDAGAPARAGAAAAQRRAGARRAPARARGVRRARALRAVPDRHRRGPPPPAADRRAPHRVRVRDVLVAALGRPRVPAARRALARARRLPHGRRPLERLPGAGRPRVPAAQRRLEVRDRDVPEPGRRDRVRAGADGVGRAAGREPGPRARARRRDADHRPHRDARTATRSCPPTRRTGSSA